MSIGISIQFLAGRFHATPWEHQVNEGIVEWPPSPWRILRALVSAYHRLPSPPPRTEVCQLLTQLAEHQPSYALPDCVTAHTRHYMPVWKEGKETTTKVFDTFLVLAGGTLSADATVEVVWPDVKLNLTQRQLLQQLCTQVGYLGRAESWAELSVIETNTKPLSATPLSSQANPQAKAKRVKVLAPLTAEGLEGFQAALATLPKSARGKAKWKPPTDILEALELDIAELHAQGWNGIPGTRWLTYEQKEEQQFGSQRGEFIFQDAKPPTFARFALASNVLPNLTQAVSVGERFRQALMSHSKDEFDTSDPIFSGRDENGDYRQDHHQHAWYLSEDADQDGKIDHVVVYAEGGFQSQVARKALHQLQKVWGNEGFDIQTVLVSLGQPEDYGVEVGYPHEGRSLVVGRGRRWRSYTPMVLPRHPKCNRRGEPRRDPKTDFHDFQLDGPEQQALRLLKQQKFKIPVDSGVEFKFCDDQGTSWLGWADDDKMHIKVRCLDKEETRKLSWWPSQPFQRCRYLGNGRKGSNKGYWLEIEFEKPQQGPIALGYAAHFGLGVFVPVA